MADSIEKLALNDRSLSLQRESSSALGQGQLWHFFPTHRRLSNGIPWIPACWNYCGSTAPGVWIRGTPIYVPY